MGVPREAARVVPVLGVLAASPEVLGAAREVAARELGPLDLESEISEWKATAYYVPEMGPEIWRQFLSFADLRRPEELVDIKWLTNDLENRWRTERGRRVNLDPGYVDAWRLVLTSTKDAAHRVYVGRGIYAETTLRFEHGRFRSWEWTYPDYATAAACEFFTRVRARWRAQRRARDRRAARSAGGVPGSALRGRG